jgi:hypothetical protein
MRVFLGWAGEEAKAVALALKAWLPLVCPGIKPWISDDITKGSRWSADIAKTLRESKAGIFVLTPDNLGSVWVHYEAGAISNVEGALVCTFLRRVDRAAVKAPLDVFQHTTAGDEADTQHLVLSLEKLLTPEERQWDKAQLESAFTKWWPELRDQLGKITPPAGGAVADRPPVADMVAEVLGLVRSLDARERERVAQEEQNPFAAYASGWQVAPGARWIAPATWAGATTVVAADDSGTVVVPAEHGTTVAAVRPAQAVTIPKPDAMQPPRAFKSFKSVKIATSKEGSSKESGPKKAGS